MTLGGMNKGKLCGRTEQRMGREAYVKSQADQVERGRRAGRSGEVEIAGLE
jgi:hypothetical protein